MHRIAVLSVVACTLMSTAVAQASAAAPRTPLIARAVRTPDTVLRGARHADDRRIPAGRAEAFAFRAQGSGRVGAINLHLGSRDRAKRLLVALFSDRGGRPGALMAAGSSSSLRTGAWNAVAVPATDISSGTRYWVALLGKGGAVSLRAGHSLYLTMTRTSRASHKPAPVSRKTTTGTAPTTPTPTPTPPTMVSTSPVATTPVTTTVPRSPVGTPPVTVTDPSPPTPPPAPPDDCDLTATPASFTAQVSAAKAGQTVCLASGSYGTWRGVDKAIVVAASPGAAPTMTIEFASGAGGFTLDGMRIVGGDIDQGASNLTIEDSAFTAALTIDGLANANVTLTGDSFDNISDNASCTGEPARIHLDYYATGTPSGVTIEYSTFDGGNADGIQTGAPVVIRDNLFENIRERSATDCQHTDSIQGVAAYDLTVVGNLFHNDSDGLVDFDDSTDDTATDNACYAIDRGACVTLYGDRDSVVEHNAAGPGMNVLEIDTKPGHRAGTGTIFEDNVGGVSEADGSTLGADSGNLFPGATSPNVSGNPTFAGGANPTTWAGFELAGTSGGYAADDEVDAIGVQAGVDGPPIQ